MEWKFSNKMMYSEDENKQIIATVEFEKNDNGDICVTHVVVDDNYRGKGIAGAAMKRFIEYIKENKQKITATCTYANAYLKKNEEDLTDILSDRLKEEIVACRLHVDTHKKH